MSSKLGSGKQVTRNIRSELDGCISCIWAYLLVCFLWLWCIWMEYKMLFFGVDFGFSSIPSSICIFQEHDRSASYLTSKRRHRSKFTKVVCFCHTFHWVKFWLSWLLWKNIRGTYILLSIEKMLHSHLFWTYLRGPLN